MTTTTNFKKAGSRNRSLVLAALGTLIVFLMASETWGYTVNRQRHKELTYWERYNLEVSRQIRLQKEQEIQRQEAEKRRKMEQREIEAKSRVAQTRQEGERILDETRKELLRKRESCGTALSMPSAGGGYGAEDAEWDARFRTVQEQLSKIETLEADVESFAVQVAALSGNGKKNSPRR